MEAPIDSGPMDELAALLHMLTMSALREEAAAVERRRERAEIAALLVDIERRGSGMSALARSRLRPVVGRVRHAFGIEVRAELPQVVGLVRAVEVRDVGAGPGAVRWLLLILDRDRTHAHVLSDTDVERLRDLAADDYAAGEVRIWIDEIDAGTGIVSASGFAVDVVVEALLEGLKDG